LAFRPCIDLRGGKVVQIVGGTLDDASGETVTNFVSDRDAVDFASLYRRDGLLGGHIIMLGPGNEQAARRALGAYPGGLQIGGGITPDNAAAYLDAGASHVVVTSFLFESDALSNGRLDAIADAVGKRRLVIDLSCRRGIDGAYRVATNRWQTVTSTVIEAGLFAWLGEKCDEFLVHAADVEGRQEGIDEGLVMLLGSIVTRPTTYAGGADRLESITRVEALSNGKLDLTIGSALDIFGGSGVRYTDAARLGRRAPIRGA
jgi:phosphoribosylformimino-5-aminoimidazole carboxamide ribotide isomerase